MGIDDFLIQLVKYCTLINLSRDAQRIGFGIKEIDMGGGLGIQYFGLEDWDTIKKKIKNTRKENYTWANEFIGYEYNSDLNDLEWVGEELACKYTPDTFIQKLLQLFRAFQRLQFFLVSRKNCI